MKRQLQLLVPAADFDDVKSSIVRRDEALQTLSGDMAALTGACDALKRLVDGKMDKSTWADAVDTFVTRDALKQSRTAVERLSGDVERLGGEVAAQASRLGALSQHMDDAAEATSTAIKRSAARFQADIDRVVRVSERAHADRAAETRDLSSRVSDVVASLAGKADSSALQDHAATFVTRTALSMELQAFVQRDAFHERTEPLEVALTSMQSRMAGLRDALHVRALRPKRSTCTVPPRSMPRHRKYKLLVRL